MFATVCSMNGKLWRSSWFDSLEAAITYGGRMPGVLHVEHIGFGFVHSWEGRE